MLWTRRRPEWFIDPTKVAFGTVVEDRRNLSRSHVRVQYRGVSDPRFVPLVAFVRRCQKAIRDGAPLDIEHLLVAPILKRRYAKFFDGLTDWTPAARRAYRRPTPHVPSRR